MLFKECCYQFLVAEGLRAAWAQSREGSCYVAGTQAALQWQTLQPSKQEACVKAVARAYGVDRRDGNWKCRECLVAGL